MDTLDLASFRAAVQQVPYSALFATVSGAHLYGFPYHHYAGFARNQIKLFERESPRRVKTLLHIYRVQAQLESAFQESRLPEAATNRPALHDFLVRVRLEAPRG